MPISSDGIKELKDFFTDKKLAYDDDLRGLLFNNVNFRFFQGLKQFKSDLFQLSGDLNRLNEVERLADGSVPFAIWLRNGTEELADFDTEKIFNSLLDELNTSGSTAAPISNPANIPAVEVKEAIVQRNDMVSFGFLLGGAAAGVAVAQLQVPRHDDGTPKKFSNGDPEVHQGTGWLVTPDLIVTNHHVVNARRDQEGNASEADLNLQSRNTKLRFDFDTQDFAGNAIGVTTLEVCDPALDFAILRLTEPVKRKPLSLNPDRIEITQDSYIAVNIIQHPYGGPKRVALRNNLIYDSNFPKLRYFTDTDHGSSGSPVFNDLWQVVALHRASTFVRSVQFQGRQAGWVNEGTHILAILDFLKANKPSLHEEITAKG